MLHPLSPNMSSARFYASLVLLVRDPVFDLLVKYFFLWMILLAIIAGFVEARALHSSYSLYNLDVPIKLL